MPARADLALGAGDLLAVEVDVATLQAPFRLKPAGRKVQLAPKFDRYELVAGAGPYDLAVPKKDGELVRHAFGGAAGLR